MTYLPYLNVGDKLVVGQFDNSATVASLSLLPGTLSVDGPAYFGKVLGPEVPRATCMIAPSIISPAVALEVTGISNFLGPVTNILGVLNVPAVSNFFGAVTVTAVEVKNGVDIKNAVNLGNDVGIFNEKVTINAPLSVTGLIFCGDINAASITATFGAFASVAAPFKLFDVPHPNKKGMRLRHACIEGPEVGVYYRGKLNNQNQIILPDYWENLIDPETITVNLTPHTTYQELYVKNIEWGKVINIGNNLSGSINCDYIVCAERKDVEKLVIEYKENEDN